MNAFATCRNRPELLQTAQECIAAIVPCRRRRVFFWEDIPADQRALFEENPLISSFRSCVKALHQAQIVDSHTWRTYCPRADHGQVLVGPVVAGSQLVGSIAITRLEGDPPFGDAEIASMNRFCLYFSSRWAELGREEDPGDLRTLTPREQDVCRGVFRGRRNAEIAAELCLSEHTIKQNLKAIFRKLKVRSRTEMVKVMREHQSSC